MKNLEKLKHKQQSSMFIRKNEYRVNKECLTENLVFKERIKTENERHKTFLRDTEVPWERIFYNHKNIFKK